MPLRSGEAVALTLRVKKAGCASKIGQADLLRILGNLPPVTDPNVLLGAAAGDDAGVYKMDNHTALVQTVDVFTPSVDDPYTFGQIAAANSVSDIYAMGGRPLTALSIIGFPIDDLDGAIMEAILRGGMDKLAEADCALIGGHSIADEEIKCGFAVTGLIDPNGPIKRAAAQPGDALVLTKPLGTGMIAFAAQLGRISAAALEEAGAAMATLNKDAAELMVKHGAHACTDVTGFGLAGHLAEMARGSGVTARIDLSRLPVFGAVRACIANEIVPGGIERNQEYAMAWVRVEGPGADENTPDLAILYDPQTSGGLLVALPKKNARAYVDEMKSRGHAATAIIGEIVTRAKHDGEGKVVVTNTELRNFIGTQESVIMIEETKDASAARKIRIGRAKEAQSGVAGKASAEGAAQAAACCANPPGPQSEGKVTPVDDSFAGHVTMDTAESLSFFTEFMKEANRPGAIDARGKKLMAIALSVAFRCKPCMLIHIRSALAMGVTKTEIHEAANLAISFAGCPAMMAFKEVADEVGL